MEKTAALYLAHLNPFTNAHKEIISKLQKKYRVYVFPVRFIRDGKEINTRSFPFTFQLREQMIRSVFPDNEDVIVSSSYTFSAPFIKYIPPLISPHSWKIREQIIKTIEERKFISYTGDSVERYLMKVYRFNPIKAKRLSISASQVRELIYQNAIQQHEKEREDEIKWQEKIPLEVSKIIEENWEVIEKYANARDETLKIVGVKFPKYGFF